MFLGSATFKMDMDPMLRTNFLQVFAYSLCLGDDHMTLCSVLFSVVLVFQSLFIFFTSALFRAHSEYFNFITAVLRCSLSVRRDSLLGNTSTLFDNILITLLFK